MIYIAIIPLISAFIGYITNYIAVKMLFHPRRPVKVLFFTLHGIFPKRHEELAENLGDLVEKELISHNDITEILHDDEFIDNIKIQVQDYFTDMLVQKAGDIHPMLPMVINDEIIIRIKDLTGREFEKFIPVLLAKITSEIEDKVAFREIVREKVREFSMEKLEDILFAIMKKEFRFIEIIGGVLGFIIGVLQIFYINIIPGL